MKLSFKEQNRLQLKQNFEEACQDPVFVNLIKKLQITPEEAYKMTSKLELSASELKKCAECQGFYMCQNSLIGHVSLPKRANGQLFYTYEPCKYMKKMVGEQKEKEKLAHFNEEARMKDIDVSDKKRIKAVKWLDKFFSDYNYNKPMKGLYLYGNFGSGKTFLISALFNELKLKKNITTEIVYFPEILRTLKNDWDLYESKIHLYETVDLLCLDDIGAEKVSDWARDEVLGTILQTRMNHHKTTFFTSNLTLEDLEAHFKIKDNVEESLKARRIN